MIIIALSEILGFKKPFTKSIEIVELDTKTNDASVDIDADKIRTIIMPISAAGKAFSSIVGMIISAIPLLGVATVAEFSAIHHGLCQGFVR